MVVVDDHEAVRTGLERVLDRAPDLERRVIGRLQGGSERKGAIA